MNARSNRAAKPNTKVDVIAVLTLELLLISTPSLKIGSTNTVFINRQERDNCL